MLRVWWPDMAAARDCGIVPAVASDDGDDDAGPTVLRLPLPTLLPMPCRDGCGVGGTVFLPTAQTRGPWSKEGVAGARGVGRPVDLGE